nr:polyprenyl synthetase family protein [Anaerolineae bacterium]
MMNLEQALDAVNRRMESVVASDVAVLERASRHIISAGGKRVRPRILLLTYLANGGTDLEIAVPVSAAIELVHTATLVHDDINDHGTMRRGRVTINEKWGRTFALLTGDFLFTKVYELMAPYGDLNITFAEATVALVEGETLQASAAKDNSLNREIYQMIVAKKTASLFRASAMLGAQLADAEKTVVDTYGEYGFYVGLAFQIVDDLLDLVGDTRLMGKQSGVDMIQGKGVAAAVSVASDNGGVHDNSAVLLASEQQIDPFGDVKRRMIETGAVAEGQNMARIAVLQAHASLDKLPRQPYMDELRKIVDQVLHREK